MQGYFDIHCHILPGIDDGPKSIDETCRMLYIAYEEGIRVIAATPHYVTDNPKVSRDKILERYNEVNQAIAEAGIKLSIILGSEILFSMDTIDALKKGEALSMDGTRYILVEFLPSASFREIWNGLNHCIFAGYIPILAHVERYQCLTRDSNMAQELIRLGAYLQMNVSSIRGRILDSRVRFCRKLLKKGWVHFLGTDAHGAYDRVPRVESYMKTLRKSIGKNQLQQLLWENPMTMLENRHI